MVIVDPIGRSSGLAPFIIMSIKLRSYIQVIG